MNVNTIKIDSNSNLRCSEHADNNVLCYIYTMYCLHVLYCISFFTASFLSTFNALLCLICVVASEKYKTYIHTNFCKFLLNFCTI